jgi:uncharacterized protein (TIGR02145 family)
MKNDMNTFRADSQDCTVEKPHKQALCLQMRELVFRLSKPATGFLLAGLLSLFFVGCIQEDSRSKDGEGTSISISSLSTAGMGTKSTTSIVAYGVSLGAFRVAANGYTAQNNAQYTYSTSWSAASPITLNGTAASVCAYYPYGAAGITGSTNPAAVTLTSQKYDAAQDLCYATNVAVQPSSSPTVNFAMQRAYAQLTFTINSGSLFTGTGNITNISISNAGIISSGSFKITDGTFNSTTPGVVSFNPGIDGIVSGYPAPASVLMVPVTTAMTGNLNLFFTVDGKVLTASLPVSTNGLATLAAGNNYNINIQLGLTLQAAANCYIVAPGASTVIPVGIKGNNGNVAGTGLSPALTPGSVGVVWQTTSGLVTWTNFNATSKTVTITAGPTSGNAVIAAYSGANQTGTILWSWHIWVTDYNPNTGTTYFLANTYTSNVFMDRNLGATSATAGDVNTMGLLYQWGRKDPFPGSTSFTTATEPTLVGTSRTKATTVTGSNLSNSILHPTIYYFGTTTNSYDWYSLTASTHNDLLWGGAAAGDAKTIFDPCPAGWRVPSMNKSAITYRSPWEQLAYSTGAFTSSSQGYGGTFSNYGWSFTYNSVGIGYYPVSGAFDSSGGMLGVVGSNGYYWAASAISYNGYSLSITNSSVSVLGSTQRAYGFSVRCVQE